MLSLIHAMFVAGAVSTKSGLPREEFETGLPSSGKYFFARLFRQRQRILTCIKA